MATERFIRGKVDSANHDGRASNTRRLEAAIYHEQNWQDEIIDPEPLVESTESVVMLPNREYHI